MIRAAARNVLAPILTIGLTLVLAVTTARAQTADNPREAFFARQLARVTLLQLRLTDQPTQSDYRLAAALLGLARERAPDDLEILRRQIEAAANAGESQQVLELSRYLVAKDPGDTLTQLRLITSYIAQNAQNAEDRIRVYEQFLDAKGKGRLLDPSIRSRLALDEALLLRERGDEAGFLDHLSLATQLDPSHKEAQALAATVFEERRPGDAVGRMQMLEHLLMADPIDPNIQLSIARQLAAAGAFKAAERFQQNAIGILEAVAASTEEARNAALVFRWQAEGPEQPVRVLTHDLDIAKDRVARDVKRLLADNPNAEVPQRPEDVHLPIDLQIVLIMANDAAGDHAAAKAALADLAAQAQKTIDQLRDPNKRGNLNDADAQRGIADLAIEIDSTRLWANTDLDIVRKDLADNGVLGTVSPDVRAMMEGWLAVRSGDPARGLAILEPLSEGNLIAELGVGVAHEALNEPDRAKAVYADLVRRATGQLVAAWSRTRLAALGVKDDPASAADVAAAAAKIPLWVDQLCTRPSEFVQLIATVPDRAPEALAQSAVTLTIRNLTPIPLGLGPDRPINSRMLIAPKLDELDLGASDLIRPEIVDIDRRLRLAPKEQFTVTVWPDAGQAGWLMEALANRSLRIRWRVIQGFVSDPGGGFRPGAMCIATDTEAGVRRPMPEASLPTAALAQRIGTEPEATMMRLAAAVRAELLQPILAPRLSAVQEPDPRNTLPIPDAARPGPRPAPAPPSADLKPVADAFTARYPSLDPLNRATVAVTLPHARLAPVMAPMDQAVLADPDPIVQCIALVTRIDKPDDPVLVKAQDSDDPRIKLVATLLAERLASPGRTYSRLTPADLSPAPKAARGGAATPPAAPKPPVPPPPSPTGAGR